MNLSCRPCCQASSLRVSSTPPGAEPALLTKMSMRPKCFCAPSTKALASASFVRSAAMASTLRPLALRISSAVFSSGSLRRAQIATSQPSRASAAAMPLPMPSLPPVMHAILLLSCRSMALLPDWLVLYCEKYSPHRDKSTKSAKAPPHRWSRKLAQGAQPARLLRAGASGGLDRDAGALDPRADEHRLPLRGAAARVRLSDGGAGRQVRARAARARHGASRAGGAQLQRARPAGRGNAVA